ncbi:hypothetical protein Q5P01_007088 [Channa striata]|uniref:Insulin-like domain-containing protein n=1 Tax=Channa striata TaxID=64152 RepID=A0AA88SYB2_CHASR|nr:hypothetical protein Q5P01_007088 [Channa striata]
MRFECEPPSSGPLPPAAGLYKTAGLFKCPHRRDDVVTLRCCQTAATEGAVRSAVCVLLHHVFGGWPLCTDAARLRCGSDLLSDLLFVCGDRGIYLGKGKWSGYGARPRGKGIVDQCCRPSGCDLHTLEMYCAKPKGPQPSTASPATSTTPGTTTTTGRHGVRGSKAHPNKGFQAQQFDTLFHKRLLEVLGPPNSPKREAYRKTTAPSPQKIRNVSSPRRRINTPDATSRPPSASGSPLQRPS